jgi:hypothetical protein
VPFPLKFATQINNLAAQKKNFCCPKNNEVAAQSNNFAAQMNEICCPDLRQPLVFSDFWQNGFEFSSK